MKTEDNKKLLKKLLKISDDKCLHLYQWDKNKPITKPHIYIEGIRIALERV